MRFAKLLSPTSISAKVVLAYVVGVLLSMVLLVLVAFTIAKTQGDIVSKSDVKELTEDIAKMVRFDSQGVPIGLDNSRGDLAAWLYDSLKQETAYRVLDEIGNAVLYSAAGEAFWPTESAAIKLRDGLFEFERNGIAMRGATKTIQREGRTWFFQLAVSHRFMKLSYRAFGVPFAVAGITLFSFVLLFVFGACAYFTLRYTLKPLKELSDSAAAISPRSLNTRLHAKDVPNEIAPLVNSFNAVLERLEQGYRVQQEFLSTAAHELKTPLALIRAQIDLSEPSPARTDLLQDVEHMSRQVQQLLHLAEASEEHNYKLDSVDLGGVAQEAMGYLQRMARAADVELFFERNTATQRWLADRGALFTLIKNLLENAIQHAPTGSAVSLMIDSTTLSVRDWGHGVKSEQLTTIFSRFWRGPHRRDQGAGLGLAICREIAVSHGWTLSAELAQPGLRVVLRRTEGIQPNE